MGRTRSRSSLLVRTIGFPATLLHGDAMVLDRWRWLKSRLPRSGNGESLLDVGCGSGAFAIGAARRGYKTLGLTWDAQDRDVAEVRARICGTHQARFEQFDVRCLGLRTELHGLFDVVICTENIEHIADDLTLMRAIYACLKPGGRLLLTAPNLLGPSIGGDIGPFPIVENGEHVRRGYSREMLQELCECAGLKVEYIGYCSGMLSQLHVRSSRGLARVSPSLTWMSMFPLRCVPPLLDPMLTRLYSWPGYSITLEAYKPRFLGEPSNGTEHF
jgi:SAM-dependent methyltransferase